MSSTPLRILLGSMLLIGISSAHAQIPTPQIAPAANPSAAVPVVPAATTATDQVAPFSPNSDIPASAASVSTQPRLEPEAERLTQEAREVERKYDASKGGFKWKPWSDGGPTIAKFVFERDPDARNILQDGYHVDIAITDLDRDKEPDVVVLDWGHCGSQGCAYTIYYNDKNKKPVTFVAYDMLPYSDGVILDGKRYRF
jgi:hypothetical protein